MNSALTYHKENDHWRLDIPFPYPLRMKSKYFKSEDDAKAAIVRLMEERKKEETEAARKFATIVEISDQDFSELFNASLHLFKENEAIKNFMLSLHADRRTLVIRN
jgi:hypothetical protein